MKIEQLFSPELELWVITIAGKMVFLTTRKERSDEVFDQLAADVAAAEAEAILDAALNPLNN